MLNSRFKKKSVCKNCLLLCGMLLACVLHPALATIAELKAGLAGVEGTARVDLLNRIAFSYWSQDPQQGMEFGRQALELANSLNYEKGQSRALNCLGLNCWARGDYALAFSHYKHSLDISRASGDTFGQANTLNNLGKLYIELGRNDRALEYYFQTLKIKEDAKDAYGVARVLNNIGEIYLSLKHYDEALKFFLQSLTMKSHGSGDQEGLATAYQNIGDVHRARGDFKAALEQYQKSLQKSVAIDKKSGIGDALFSIAEMQLARIESKNALDSFSRSLKIREELGDKKGVAACLNRIGLAQVRLGNYPQAQAALVKGLAIASAIGSRLEMQASYEFQAALSEARQDFSKALEFFKKYAQAKDEIFSKESGQKIASLSMLYENQQKEKESELQQLRLEKQIQMGYLLFVIIALILLLMIFVYKRYRLKVRVNRELERMNTKLDLLTRTDPLTQLANRRDFLEKITMEIARCLRSRKMFSVVLGDIDDFKKINDRYGHECGDRMLTTVAQLIRETVRKQDVLARWGGEEFILLLPETDPEGGRVLANKICLKIAAYNFKYSTESLRLTMTFGIAAYHDAQRIEDCISRADQAMYDGKLKGKNQVAIQNE